jgi:hypothetical protein
MPQDAAIVQCFRGGWCTPLLPARKKVAQPAAAAACRQR